MTDQVSSRVSSWFLSCGVTCSRIERLVGGASPRTYWRVFDDEGPVGVAVESPLGSGPTEAGSAASADVSWLRIQQWLETSGLPVPRVFHANPDDGLLFIEDLGDVRLYDEVTTRPEARLRAYEDAVDLLARFQRVARHGPTPEGLPTFTTQHIEAEIQEFTDMGLEHRLQVQLSRGERALMRSVAQQLAAELQPEIIAHRDFQSQNLMRTARGLVIIDFQDAFLAPRCYDLVALLRDSYVVLSSDELDTLLRRFAKVSDLAFDSLKDAFYLQTIQRKLKDSGRFETLARRGKTSFLAFYPDSIAYVVRALQASGRFPDLLELLCTHLPEARSALS